DGAEPGRPSWLASFNRTINKSVQGSNDLAAFGDKLSGNVHLIEPPGQRLELLSPCWRGVRDTAPGPSVGLRQQPIEAGQSPNIAARILGGAPVARCAWDRQHAWLAIEGPPQLPVFTAASDDVVADTDRAELGDGGLYARIAHPRAPQTRVLSERDLVVHVGLAAGRTRGVL